MKNSRRKFIKTTGQLAAGLGFMSTYPLIGCNETESTDTTEEDTSVFFKISLAQWSLHKAFGFNPEKTVTLDNLDFAAKAKNDFGIDAVEYVNHFFFDKAQDKAYLKEMNMRASDNEVRNVLIMVDREGELANIDAKLRNEAVENHKKWLEAAATLGCHAIRVNLFGHGDRDEMSKAAIEGLGKLAEVAQAYPLNVIVENHGWESSDAGWLTNVIKTINMDNCGTLPDFGNFCTKKSIDERAEGNYWSGECIEEYDMYKGVEEMMPYAMAVSAKSYDFDETGLETKIDYARMLQLVKAAKYTGYIGVEYEGSRLSEDEGILATKELLLAAAKEIS